jgi:uncharacterized protein (TIGR04255 family)
VTPPDPGMPGPSPAASSPGRHAQKSVKEALTNVDFLRQCPQSQWLRRRRSYGIAPQANVMAKPQKKLRNPPITEAVIDFTVQFTQPQPPDKLLEFEAFIEGDYPNCEPRRMFMWRFEKEGVTRDESSIVGYLHRSADATRAVQTKTDGISFSRLKPYDDWDTSLTEAWRLWRIYSSHFKPLRVQRLATRFINRLELPGPQLDFDDYLLIGPRLPEEVPQVLAQFNTAVTIPAAEGTNAVIRTAYPAPGPTGSTIDVILDIDISRQCDVDSGDHETLLRLIQELRPIKNTFFFGSLTEKAVELFA